MKVTLIMPPLRLPIPALAMAQAIGERMLDHWVATFTAGLNPDGSARPLNAEGAPMGSGDGSLESGWQLEVTTSGTSAAAEVSPRTDGKWLTVVDVLHGKGCYFTGIEGESLQVYDETVAAVIASHL